MASLDGDAQPGWAGRAERHSSESKYEEMKRNRQDPLSVDAPSAATASGRAVTEYLRRRPDPALLTSRTGTELRSCTAASGEESATIASSQLEFEAQLQSATFTSLDDRTSRSRPASMISLNSRDELSASSVSSHVGLATSSASNPPVPIQKAKKTAPEVGGYDADLFVEPLSLRHRCPICYMGLKYPMQTPCGHRFCNSCIQRVRETTCLCPVDRQPLDQIFADNFCRREVLDLHVKCSHHGEGCPWQGELRNAEEHQTKCELEPVPCPNDGCPERVLRVSLVEHAEKCQFRVVECEHCHQRLLFSGLKAHIRDNCLKVIKVCPHNCGGSFPRDELQLHTATCPEAPTTCPYSFLGCTAKGTRAEMELHKSNAASMQRHFDLACKVLQEKDGQIVSLQAIVQQQQAMLSSVETRLQALEAGAVRQQEQNSTFAVQLQTVEQLAEGAQRTPRTNDSVLAQRVLTLETVATTTDQNMAIVQRQLSDVRSGMARMSQNTDTYTKIADVHDLRLLGLETASYDGSLTWKINIKKAMDDARSGIKQSIYSPPFYSSRHGFKMCARLYPLGDGTGRGSHMSFFFVIMRGDFDALLPWPFRQRVTMTILDQSTARRHISETFLPDVRSSSFQRPTSGMNVASGCPRFISHDLLNSPTNTFIKDDMIFLRISIDTTTLNTN